MPDIQMKYKGEDMTPDQGATHFAEYLIIEGEGGPIIDQMLEHMRGYLTKTTPDL